MQVEIHELELRYASLRVIEPGRQARLVASLASEGQRSPVLGVDAEQGRCVLIDGYRRVEGLKRLGRDVVELAVLPVSEAEALVLTWQLEATRRRSALEDAWLLQELVEAHGMRQVEVAVQLRRSRSWVSQRLALVGVLPTPVQDAVRRGVIPAQAAMKHMVPWSRTNAAHCERVVDALQGTPVTVRQVERLYLAWRRGDEEQRERIVGHPQLFLRADEATAEPGAAPDATQQVATDLEKISGLCRKVRQRLREGVFARANKSSLATALQSWEEARAAFEALATMMDAEASRA